MLSINFPYYFSVYYRIYRKSDDYNVIEGVRYKGCSIKIIEQAGEYIVVLRYFIFKKIPYSTEKFPFETLQEAEVKYEFLKNYLRRFS